MVANKAITLQTTKVVRRYLDTRRATGPDILEEKVGMANREFELHLLPFLPNAIHNQRHTFSHIAG